MIVLDTNVLISALLKDSLTRKTIISSGFAFCYPEISLEEIRKYESYIIKKGGYTQEEYRQILNTLLQYIRLVPLEVIQPYLTRAKEIMNSIDINDTVFVATAFALTASFIWSDDSDFDRQHAVKVLKTKDMIKLIEKSRL